MSSKLHNSPAHISLHYQPLSNTQECKLLAKEFALNVYCMAINVFSRVLNLCSMSCNKLDKHVFKINILCEYARVESSHRHICKMFEHYLKVPMLNMPRIEVVLEGSDLKKAKEYLHQFHVDCEINFDKWYIDALDSFLIKINDDPNTETNIRWKHNALGNFENRMEQRKRLFQISNFQHPLKGVCGVVVANIFKTLKENKTSNLASIVAKYKNGVGKKIAGLESFKGALWDSWAALEKMFPSYKAFASQEAVYFHTLNRLNVTEEITEEVKTKYSDNFDEPIGKINRLNDGCYSIELIVEKTNNKDQLHHSIFIRKQANELEIVDPAIGLLESHDHKKTNELLEKLLGFYVKKNKIYNLFIHRMS